MIVPLILAVAAAGGLKWKHDADFRPLYSSLAPADASAVTQKIREAGIEYRLDETGSTVLVPVDKIAEARLALAGAGMPRSGRIGFELFDRSNLGASDFAEQVNYQRALEGELERTVETLAEIEEARIHITPAKESVFLDSRQPAKATAVLKPKGRAQIRQTSVAAIANLLAGAVDGLDPESVSVIDDAGRLLNRPRASDAEAAAAEAGLDYRKQIEADLQSKMAAALEPLLGAGKFRTGVTVDCDFTSIDQNEEIYETANPVKLTSQTTEESNGNGISGGTPGTASNLPSPPPKSQSSSSTLRRTENASWQPNRTVRHTINPKGTVRKISTVVLVDHTIRWEGAGSKARKVITPPSPDLLKAVHDVAAGIVSLNEQRGDLLTVESLPFDSTTNAEPPGLTSPTDTKTRQQAPPKLLYEVGGGAVGLVLVAGVAMVFLRKKKRPGSGAVADENGQVAIEGIGNPASEIPGFPSAEDAEQAIQDKEKEQARLEAEVIGRIKLPEKTQATEVLVRQIRGTVQKDPAAAANVLRSWITDKGRKS